MVILYLQTGRSLFLEQQWFILARKGKSAYAFLFSFLKIIIV